MARKTPPRGSTKKATVRSPPPNATKTLSKLKKLYQALKDDAALRRRWLKPRTRTSALAAFDLSVRELEDLRPGRRLKPMLLVPWPPSWGASVVVTRCDPPDASSGRVTLTITGTNFQPDFGFMLVGPGLSDERIPGVVTGRSGTTRLTGTVTAVQAGLYEVVVGNEGTNEYGRLQEGFEAT